jgi:hypothetical protein
MTDVEIQRMRANVYREELLDSHAVIEKLEKEIRELKAELEDEKTCHELCNIKLNQTQVKLARTIHRIEDAIKFLNPETL